MSTAERLSNDLPAEQETDPLIGRVLNDKFKLMSLIATGGMGTIYQGEQLTLQRPVAVKVLSPTTVASSVDPNFHKRFFLEASILSRLQHPNIVTVFDYGRIEGMSPERYFMAMEFLAGETLFRHLRARGHLPPPEAMAISRQIARGLREAHKQGVVHRDLKPSNIMLVPGEDGGELVKILDFGLVKVLADDSEELTQQGAFLGSPRYMSPEQISHGKVDLRTDVYSLGVILYQLLCGKVPFESEKSVQILIAHLQQPVPRMRERNPDVEVPEPLEAFVMSCLAKNPDSRPANMDAFIRLMADCAHSIGLSGQFGSTGVVAIDSASGFRTSPMPTGQEVGSKSEAVRKPIVLLGEAVHDPTPAPVISCEVDGGVDDSSSNDASRERLRSGNTSSAAHAAPPRHEIAGGTEGGSSGKRTGLLVLGAIGAIAAAVVLSGRIGSSPPQVDAAVQPAVVTPQTVVAPPVEPAKVTSFTVQIDSVPEGADVMEGDRLLGKTPLKVQASNEETRREVRVFRVELKGYLPHTMKQGPSEDPLVHLLAKLDAEKVEPVKTGGGYRRPPPRPPVTAAPTSDGKSLDIAGAR